MTSDLIEVGVVGPSLLRQAVVSLLTDQSVFQISEPSQAQVWVEVGATPNRDSSVIGTGNFILVGAPPTDSRTMDIGAFIGYDESSAVLCEAILAVAALSRQRLTAA